MTSEAAEAAALWDARPQRLIRARENSVYEVTLADGSRAALRLHRQGYQGEAAIRSELWLCAALARAGLPVPAALPARDGALLVHLSGGRAASLVRWLDGQALGEGGVPLAMPPDRQAQLHHDLGRLLRRLHAATAALPLPPEFTRPRWDRDGLVGEAPFWGRFWDHPAANEGDAATLRAARHFLADHLADQPPPQIIHADVLRENVLVNDKSVSLIDFDDCGWGYPLYDLGTALVQNLAEPAYPAIRDALMQGYGTQDRAGVEAMVLARACASVGWTMPRLAPDDPIHTSHIARATGWARRLGI